MTMTFLSNPLVFTLSCTQPFASLAESVSVRGAVARVGAETFHLQCQFLAFSFGIDPLKLYFLMILPPEPDDVSSMLVSSPPGQFV